MTPMTSWLSDETLKMEFVRLGGAEEAFHNRKRALRCVPESLASGGDCGYVYVEPNLFAEGPLWVYTSAARRWMPFALQPNDRLSFFDEHCRPIATLLVSEVRKEQVVDMFLRHWCTLEPRSK